MKKKSKTANKMNFTGPLPALYSESRHDRPIPLLEIYYLTTADSKQRTISKQELIDLATNVLSSTSLNLVETMGVPESVQYSNEEDDQSDIEFSSRATPSIPSVISRQHQKDHNNDENDQNDNNLNKINDNKHKFWAHIITNTASDCIQIAQAFGLHPLTVEDICGADSSREKLETFQNYLYFSVDCIDPDSDQFVPVHIVVLESCVLSFCRKVLYPMENCFDRVSQEIDRRSKKRESFSDIIAGDWILYFIIDGVIDDFIPEVYALNSEAENIDELVFLMSPTERSDLLRRIGMALQKLRKLQPTLATKEDILRKLSSSHNPNAQKPIESFISVDPRRYLMDVLDHIVEGRHSLHFTEHLLETSAQNYLAQVSVEMAEASNRMSIQMKRLSLVATIMLPLSLVAGLFGMNCKVPVGDIDSLDTFYSIIGSMGMFILISLWFLRESLWMRKKSL
eukprot:c19752_g1_i1.p1 GENE.c19752_g1_i1~~c19752_g1_i1.p1  ORF type:complete len:454 (-),score=165.10 c19752_g1_i1:120-1481(-)